MILDRVRADMVQNSPSPFEVGRAFVHQYYTLLHQAPNLLHRFYSTDSTFIHGGVDRPGNVEQPAVGPQDISRRITDLNLRDCHAKIRQVDSHPTIGDGVVVQVTGELSNGGEPMRRFMQTFVLAPRSPKKYYVQNDIFRYQDEVFDDQSDDDRESTNFGENSITDKVSIAGSTHMQASTSQQQTQQSSQQDQQPPTSSSTGVHQVLSPRTQQSSTSSYPGTAQTAATESLPPRETTQHQVENVSNTTGDSNVANGLTIDEEGSYDAADHQSTLDNHSQDQQSGVQDQQQHIPDTLPTASQQPQKQTTTPESHTSYAGVVTKSNPPLSSTTTSAPLARTQPTNVPPSSSTGVRPPAQSNQQQLSQQPTSRGQQNSGNGSGGFTRPSTTIPPSNQQQARRGNDYGGGRNFYPPRQGQQIGRWSGDGQDDSPDRRGSGGGNRRTLTPNENQVFVGSLPPDFTADILRDFFSGYGPVVDVRIFSPQNAEKKNFGFVVFEDSKPAQKVLEQQHVTCKGYRLNVEEKTQKKTANQYGGTRIGRNRPSFRGSATGTGTLGRNNNANSNSIRPGSGNLKNGSGGTSSEGQQNDENLSDNYNEQQYQK
ncbi:unnamed protein product [Didymodactylos carnosus]|uniref:Uncharacterized protein n=1 Tax=Didymodactylos carnosus TaxID=1234261 RepID=A0A814DYP3_9BILA|nr:unnamed protein product [Didymodactylos carnosus]CAF1204867.1 unnamed protein product [Didymodactylos carnosus]CAF3736657.1 unnamed protein product [Didymodactylos carnosus]CAF4014370.1 unnamed protein product [Didymodactylos carnosus]